MNRLRNILLGIIAIAACRRLDGPQTLTFPSPLMFSISDSCNTKAPNAITSSSELGSIYVSADGASSFSNATFVKSGRYYAGDPAVDWPDSDPEYKFFASNVAMDDGRVSLSAANNTDIVCAYNERSSYKKVNRLSFRHILARIRYVKKGSYDGSPVSVSDVRIRNYGNSGTYDIATKKWSDIGMATSSLCFDGVTDNNLWVIPGTYVLTITYIDATGTPVTRSTTQKFVAESCYDITCTADNSALPVTDISTEYGKPTFDSTPHFDPIPTSGGTAGPVEVSNVRQQRRTVYTYSDNSTSTGEWESFSPDGYTVEYSRDSVNFSATPQTYTAPDIRAEIKPETTIGYLYTRVLANGQTSDVHSAEVRQEGNITLPVIEKWLEYGKPTFDSTPYFEPISASGGTAGPVVISNVQQQYREILKYADGTTSAGKWETFSPDSYTAEYSKDGSNFSTTAQSYTAPSLLAEIKMETSLGYLYTRVSANGKTSDVHSAEVRQKRNSLVSSSSSTRYEVDWYWEPDNLPSDYDSYGKDPAVELKVNKITVITITSEEYSSQYVKTVENTEESAADETTRFSWDYKVSGDNDAVWGIEDDPYIYVKPNSGAESRSWVYMTRFSHNGSGELSLMTPTLRQEGYEGGGHAFSCGFRIIGDVCDDHTDWSASVDHIELLDDNGRTIPASGIADGYTMFPSPGTYLRIYCNSLSLSAGSFRFNDFDSWVAAIATPEDHCDASFSWSDPTAITEQGTMAVTATGTGLSNPGIIITIRHNMNADTVENGCLCNVLFQ